MAVFLTGDIHGGTDFGKVEDFARAAEGLLARDDYLVILGDFGLVWRDPPARREEELLDWLEDCPFTTLFIDGNHENFDLLDALPAVPWAGGHVHEVRPHVLHLMRGETFFLCGHSFFVVGGGHSIDKRWRTPHVSWWPQEVPNEEERARITAAAQTAGEVDYVLTHCPPTGQYERYRARWSGFWGPSDEFTDWMEEHIEGVVSYKRWFFGHLHIDQPLDEPHTALFDTVFDLDDFGCGITPFATHMGTCPSGEEHDYQVSYTPPLEGEEHGHATYVCSRCRKAIPLR